MGLIITKQQSELVGNNISLVGWRGSTRRTTRIKSSKDGPKVRKEFLTIKRSRR